MAFCTSWWVLMGLLGVCCEATKPVDKMCTELITNRSYSCEGLELTKIPDQLPSMTKVLDFSFNFLYSLHPSTFSKLRELVFLDLTRCQINWVYEDAFENNSHLETIILMGNLLLFIGNTAFAGPLSLKHLDLTQTGLTGLRFIPMQDLGSLEILILGNNYIQSLKFPSNFKTRNLKYLDFQMNNIQKISAKDVMLFKKLSNLTLILKGNDIVHIDPGAFSSISFYSLDLSGCVDIPIILKGLEGGRSVALHLGTFLDSDVLPISPTALQSIGNVSVDHLTLQYRTFLNLSCETFKWLTKLQTLDLTHTSLSEIPLGHHKIDMLKEINLNNNEFVHLCDIRPSAYPTVTHLYIRGNSKELDLGAGCLDSLSNLQYLDLSNSQIEDLDCCRKQFSVLNTLQHVNMSYNKKLFLHSTAFNGSAHLKVLDLAFTRIETTNASEGPFSNLRFLQILNLSFSQIGPNIQHILQGLESLRVLNLKGNNFEPETILNGHLFQQVYNLEVLILSHCKLLAIETKAFSALRKLQHVDVSHNDLITFNSGAFFNLRNIYLNFANNGIHIIPRDMLTNLSGQSIINLSYNPLECTCSNTGLLTWYKQNIDKIEGFEETVCSEPKSLAGTKLLFVNLSCGYSNAKVILITFVVITVIAVTFILIICFLQRKYQHI
ncbi:CD180 antigen [Anolis sagrei]|uniref:CD180 antigen n=1 Tax=Anolis sagrei TaxID=38937 RepID=UPI00352101FF